MIHSRPGFAQRSTDDTVAKLNDDMIPAIHRDAPKETTPLKQSLQARAEVAHEKLKVATPVQAPIFGIQVAPFEAQGSSPGVEEFHLCGEACVQSMVSKFLEGKTL